MKFTTRIRAIDPRDGVLKEWMGQNIEALTFGLAEDYCQRNGLGYCEVDGILISEIDENTGDKIDYDFINN